MSPKFTPAAVTELSRVGLFASLPGETLTRLAQRMEREQVGAGAAVVREGDVGDRFYVVLSGMLAVTQAGRGVQGTLRPGDHFGEAALAVGVPQSATVRALTASTLASCDLATFDEFLRALLADDG